MALPLDEEIRFVVTHPRFVGIEPADGGYAIRLSDDGHEIRLVGALEAVIRAAAEALRRTA